jgi:hypothetical protein
MPGLEADHSPPSSAEVKECVELYLHSLNTPSWRGAQLSKVTPLPLLSSFHPVGWNWTKPKSGRGILQPLYYMENVLSQTWWFLTDDGA